MELEIKDVTHIYPNGKMALNGVSLCLEPGVYGLLGANGAGKSTLMNIVTDNLRPTRGEVLMDGVGIRENGRAYRERLGYMPQQQGLYRQFTGRRFLWYMAALKGIKTKEAKGRIEELLELVNLKEAADRRIGGYSGGMKQRLLIAQAILNRPDVLVLDEPTAGLDPRERIRIRNFISDIARDKIVLLATHVVTDVECIARQILLLKDGALIKQGTPMELTGEMDGMVWEFICGPEEMDRIQQRYLISNLTMTGEGMCVRAIGDRALFPEGSRKARASMEEVYLYQMEADERG